MNTNNSDESVMQLTADEKISQLPATLVHCTQYSMESSVSKRCQRWLTAARGPLGDRQTRCHLSSHLFFIYEDRQTDRREDFSFDPCLRNEDSVLIYDVLA